MPAARALMRCSRRRSCGAEGQARPNSPPSRPHGDAVSLRPEWLDDFLSAPEQTPALSGVSIDHIDHIALAQPLDAFDEASLFYRSVLDLEVSESQELAAPDGLIRSRAATSRDGSVRVVLNVPALAAAARREGEPRQGEVQHVLFACGDAVAAAEALHARGAPLLHVSDNYYDDLAARLGLDQELLERLRNCHVLYDTDAQGGELLHFYLARTGRRVFFEVLERRGGYGGYGAPNSPVRLAAQRASLATTALKG